MKLMINIDEDIYTRLYDNGMEAFDVNEDGVRDLCKILTSVRKGVPFDIGIDINRAEYKVIDRGEF